MKVLFAVNDENISAEIVKKYQKEYKEIISYKNVYFYNAILKELQRDKSYDRIVISEELEEFTSSSYEQRDKFIFDKLDEISDEAQDSERENISIILICSDRRSKSDDILVKLFGIGIYNAMIGNDRSIDEVCKLINKPRSKKQAKVYYNIETDEVGYRPESENDVDEEEMRNILNHFKKIGKNEEQYIQSFRNIVSQYNQNQLKIIISVLPLNVKAVLEEKSPEYQEIATANGLMAKGKSSRQKIKKMTGPSEKLLMVEGANRTSKPVVVPASMEKSNIKKVFTGKIKPAEVSYQEEVEDVDDEDLFEEDSEIIEEKPKRRGRPRKNIQPEEIEEKPKRRGRPKKQKEDDEISQEMENQVELDDILPGIENNEDFSDILPGLEEEKEEFEDILPGVDDDIVSDNSNTKKEDFSSILPGFEDDEEEEETESFEDEVPKQNNYNQINNNFNSNIYNKLQDGNSQDFDKAEYEKMLTPEKKVVAFLGTTKNGTSFIVNSVAEVLSNLGVNVAILDATRNKNAYYIYTKNEENLRRTATNSFQNLIMGNPYGVQVNSNLTVYTGIPSENENIKDFGPILQTLVKNHTCVLIDCDFTTPKEYFANVQEIYLVQSMDILTIQPLTAFLRELKSKNILDESKINVVLNKVVKLRSVSTKNIIGGMAFYNDPEMSFMTELFDRNTVKYTEVPFNEEVYAKYLSGIVDCEISSNNYPKDFKTILQMLAQKIYPLASNQPSNSKKSKKVKSNPTYENRFSSSMNNTLNNMKKNY